MSKEELKVRRVASLARSMEVEGADYERSLQIILHGIEKVDKQHK